MTSKWRAAARHIATMTACIVNAENQDKKVREGLKTMEENAGPEYKAFISLIIRWQDQPENYLSQAKEALRTVGVSFPSAGADQRMENIIFIKE